jgi:PAP2 superfamily.
MMGIQRRSSASGWQVLAFPTPPVPDFPSAHAEAGGTAAAVIKAAIPGDEDPFSTTSGSLPGVTRTFAGLDAAAKENADSRVFVGYHFRHATEVGLSIGKQIGSYVAQNALQPIRGR